MEDRQSINPDLAQKIEKYYQRKLYRRWNIVLLLWLTLGVYGIWSLQEEIKLCLDYCTWSALRYSIIFNRLSAIALSICIINTISILVSHSHYILWGISDREKYKIGQEIQKRTKKNKISKKF